MNVILTIIGGLLGGGIIGFVEFLIRRKDEKRDKTKDVLEAIENLNKQLNERFTTLDQKIDAVEAKGDERDAVSARVRILRFADEMMEERRHSKDSWDQCLSDVTDYEQYCDTHPCFKNNQTEATVSYIKRNYTERLEKHDFL